MMRVAGRCAAGMFVSALVALAGGAYAQPANNVCANAELVELPAGSVKVVGGTTVGATVDGTATCGASSTTPDVWYRVVASAGGMLTAETCSGTAYNTVVSIRTACAATWG